VLSKLCLCITIYTYIHQNKSNDIAYFYWYLQAIACSKAMWLNSVLLGRFEVAGWDGCGGCGDGWASLVKVQAVDVCGNDG
jgi:hypothetical protein